MGSVGAESADRSAAVTHPTRPLATIAVVAAVIVVLDQLTKWWALDALTSPARTIDLVWTLRLRLVYNTGTAFSLTSDSGPIVSVIAVVVLVYLVRTGREQRSRPVAVCYGLVMGGTAGNLLDRVFRDGDGFLGGPVVDFVDLQWFPVFNVADAALVIGILLLVLLGFATDALAEAVDGPES